MSDKKVDQPSSKDFLESVAEAYGSKQDEDIFYKLGAAILAGKAIKNARRNK